MNLNNFTIKSQEAIQQAMQIATANGNQAIENGHIQAMNNLATLYYELNKNKKQAVELIKKLYEQEKSVLISENQIIVEMTEKAALKRRRKLAV